MKGKTRKRNLKKTRMEKIALDNVSCQAKEDKNAAPDCDYPIVSQTTAGILPDTPKRARGHMARASCRTCRTSTPVHKSNPRAKQTSAIDSQCSESISRSSGRGCPSRQVRKKSATCAIASSPPAKRQLRSTRKVKTRDTTSQSVTHSQPRFELQKPGAAEQDEPLLSSDLSIELSHHEEQLQLLSFLEDEETDEEEEELPRFLIHDKKPPPITDGVFVWHKCRNYPFWPALVKSVNRKQKKASIVFIDNPMIHKKKGFAVALRILKPLDCEEANELMCKAKEMHKAAIEWSFELIKDYSIRIACGSFSGSFIEYVAHDMSYPVRREYPQATSDRLTIVSDSPIKGLCGDDKEDSFSEQQEDESMCSKRLLPDRSHAAHNRANEKLVHFIVKQRMVEDRLLAVIRGQQQSRWLRAFKRANHGRIVNVYLEDEQQLDQVYWYLNELYSTAVQTVPECVYFIMDVLLPEAIIYAIAGVDNIPVQKAEEKYLKGRCISNRERQELDAMIERHMKK